MIPTHKTRRWAVLTTETSERLDAVAGAIHCNPSRIVELALRLYLSDPVTRQRLEADEIRADRELLTTPIEAAARQE